MAKIDLETGVQRLCTAAGIVFGIILLVAGATEGVWLYGTLALVAFSIVGWLLGLTLAWIIRGFRGR